MKHELSTEQKDIFNQLRLIQKEEKFYRRKNFILLGELGVGKSTLLKDLGNQKGFHYINFTKDYLEEFHDRGYVSFRYLTSNDFLKYISEQFSFSSSFYLIDALEPIIISIYQNGGERMLTNFFNNFFIQKPRGHLLLSISELTSINLKEIIIKSEFSDRNLFYLQEDESIRNELADKYNLPKVKVNNFKNNHYFKAYRGGSSS
ncbi:MULTISPECIES: hypothetical protein [unclassified Candidatus Frackibacter]|uniref:hypothetical protein n=1 Tax=unclassified Candidatus Frackibacter TaxID=2648818 RepID=UPI0008851685|nr:MULTISPECIES: hypothetical protein [unclassified Candidatus Frackibacter]SDC27714.1 hypothetical protein SAMN04515661_10583 [Candidatus Frackibacter sp. WG11]SEM54615.1 hypothetical protein SAMN04488698_10684 [Candidatus Frackibacter sp. WG12]SFL53748.1 hypothetical protein SAMN04488699_10510 [Candidatus Frackibacter sp. WG13]